ncbi:MAG: hypothetical protein ACJ76X_02560 [Solirubrobacteraceae bacterium]
MVGLRRWRMAYAVVVDDRAATAAESPAVTAGRATLGIPTTLAPRRSYPVAWTPLLVPLVLAAAYLVLLLVRFPTLIGWLGSQGDYASAYVLTDTISHGHSGQVVMSTQGGWVSLWFGLATHGLSFHRILWEISPALLSLATAGLIGFSVARLATRTAGVLTFALIVAASPTGLLNFTAPWAHNATLLGAALLGGFLAWLHGGDGGPRGVKGLTFAVLALSALVGAFLASDQLLVAEGIMPFLIAGLVLAFRARDWRSVFPVVAVVAGTVAVSSLISRVMAALHFTTTPSPLQIDAGKIPLHLKWLGQGLVRLGNGLSYGPQPAIRAPLTVAAAIVMICALAATFRLACRSVARPGSGRERARSAYLTFWATSLICAAGAYVLTTLVPADRYFLVEIPLVAVSVSLLLDGGRRARTIAAGATIVILASIVSLAAGDNRNGTYRGVVARQAGRIEALVRAHHLSIGYAGYWDAAPLDWLSHERLHVYPLTRVFGHTEPMSIARVAAWYRPRRNTPSYLVLAPGDDVFPAEVPPDLPRPQHEYHLGQATVATYPYDIAAYLHRPIN